MVPLGAFNHLVSPQSDTVCSMLRLIPHLFTTHLRDFAPLPFLRAKSSPLHHLRIVFIFKALRRVITICAHHCLGMIGDVFSISPILICRAPIRSPENTGSRYDP